MKLIIILLLASSTLLAGFPLIKIVDLSGDYKDKRGKAVAEFASYDLEDVKIAHKNIEVDFNKLSKNLVLKDPNTTVELKFDFEFLNIFKALSFEAVDIFSGGSKVDMNLEDLNIFIDKSVYHFNTVKMNSDITQYNQDGRDISILNGLLLSGELNVNFIDFGNINSNRLKNDLEMSNLSPLIDSSFDKKISIPVIGRYFSFKITKGHFNGSVLLDSWLNAWLRIYGDIENNEKENTLEITLSRAKLGIFSVKRFLLNKIRNLNLDSISVEGNLIKVYLGKVLTQSRD